MEIGQAPTGFARWDELLDLIRRSFASMRGRIDPPSSAERLTAAALEERASREVLLLAWDGDRLAGCAFLERRDSCGYIGKLAVDPACQGRGIGRALLAEIEVIARAWDMLILELETRVELTDNHRTFARWGFAEVSRKAHPGYDRPTSLTMRKVLAARIASASAQALPG